MKLYRDMEKAQPPKFGLEAELRDERGFVKMHFLVPTNIAQEMVQEAVAAQKPLSVSFDWKGRQILADLTGARMDSFDPSTKQKVNKGGAGVCSVSELRSKP